MGSGAVSYAVVCCFVGSYWDYQVVSWAYYDSGGLGMDLLYQLYEQERFVVVVVVVDVAVVVGMVVGMVVVRVGMVMRVPVVCS